MNNQMNQNQFNNNYMQFNQNNNNNNQFNNNMNMNKSVDNEVVILRNNLSKIKVNAVFKFVNQYWKTKVFQIRQMA